MVSFKTTIFTKVHALSRRLLHFHQPGDVVYAQTMESFIKVLKSTLSYDFLKQIDLDDIVDTMKKFQDLPQQSMIIEIIPICKLPLVNPATMITAGKLKVLFCGYNSFKNMVLFNND